LVNNYLIDEADLIDKNLTEEFNYRRQQRDSF